MGKMQEAFPETEAGSQEDIVEAHRNRRMKRVPRDISKEEAPEDPEISNMKHMLASLDVRMGAIQQKHALHETTLQVNNANLTPAASRTIAELQAQNAHLRERFQ